MQWAGLRAPSLEVPRWEVGPVLIFFYWCLAVAGSMVRPAFQAQIRRSSPAHFFKKKKIKSPVHLVTCQLLSFLRLLCGLWTLACAQKYHGAAATFVSAVPFTQTG